ncbi:hypothetical protein HRbin20_00911 [bacterium HR20]|nr:hypothetical protein HRbin20_00911 [bacterium HR20]
MVEGIRLAPDDRKQLEASRAIRIGYLSEGKSLRRNLRVELFQECSLFGAESLDDRRTAFLKGFLPKKFCNACAQEADRLFERTRKLPCPPCSKSQQARHHRIGEVVHIGKVVERLPSLCNRLQHVFDGRQSPCAQQTHDEDVVAPRFDCSTKLNSFDRTLLADNPS